MHDQHQYEIALSNGWTGVATYDSNVDGFWVNGQVHHLVGTGFGICDVIGVV